MLNVKQKSFQFCTPAWKLYNLYYHISDPEIHDKSDHNIENIEKSNNIQCLEVYQTNCSTKVAAKSAQDSFSVDPIKKVSTKLMKRLSNSKEYITMNINSDINEKAGKDGRMKLRRRGIKKVANGQLLSLKDGIIPAKQRLENIEFIVSPTQPKTLGDGNCFLYVILDQLR